MAKRDPIYGIMAEFDSPQHLVDAAKATYEAGYKKIDAYTPFPVEGLAEEIGFTHDEVPLVVLIGGSAGIKEGLAQAANAFAHTYWVAFALIGVTVVAAMFLPRKRQESHRLDDDQSEAVPVTAH